LSQEKGWVPDTQINQDILRPLLVSRWPFYLLVVVLGLIVLNGLLAWGYQLRTGMGVAGINMPVMWGIYIVNFVFWVGISHAGTLISAILRLLQADWRRPITRAAETMTTFSLIVAGMFPIIHLGRSWVFYYLIPYPSERAIWPNFRSPLLWDMTAIFTYLTGSSLFLYVAMIPDLALARDNTRGWRHKFYSILALGWRGSEMEWQRLRKACALLTVLIIPVFISVHSIVSWDFGMTVVPGWHSTIFAPYFVVGAILSGVAAVISLMAILRKVYGLEEYIRPIHFDNLGKLLLAVSLLWFYFFFAEALTLWYGGMPSEMEVIRHRHHDYEPLFLITMLCNVIIPVPLLAFKRVRNNIGAIFALSLIINVGMFLERFLIIVPSLARQRLPYMWGGYAPTWVELSITAGALAGFSLAYALFTKLFPIVAIWEVREGQIPSHD